MKKYALLLVPLLLTTINVSNVNAAQSDTISPKLKSGKIGLSGPAVIPPGQLKKIELPPPGSPVPVDNTTNLLAPDAILFLAPDALREPPGKGKPVLLPYPSEVF